uniref:Uncharacterized protein n=1 Tax=Rhizochromulina marina TaxID=1034831 RepID=A0A7S2ST39_9STRA|mmetsp:Transcript_6966/g.20126  ORF Transcript_6966/g.20126 Transcript_6966/m.20126 type:complete len:117 (+) Transcript_6966:126-476(+)|eukprot:CAMPEP_0118961862 /NCGR_PEP_ID=MMETSP1173-20130426/408_1 /TAXON_ID=1034831 /ORGANISM="Rhizochromulina marina cf, Strain CCMP1243" /LENGTH=116 /DNA_ID=CAMNT_0006910057 /DNA_START=127 /DNA_END=477 /DNA_ORIENTATION=-
MGTAALRGCSLCFLILAAVEVQGFLLPASPGRLLRPQTQRQSYEAFANGPASDGPRGLLHPATIGSIVRNQPEILEDPVLRRFFHDFFQEGPMSAMQHMSDPLVLSRLMDAINPRS